jgi:hypothetical protein
VPKRFAKMRDPMAPVLGDAVDIAAALGRLERHRGAGVGRGKGGARRARSRPG